MDSPPLPSRAFNFQPNKEHLTLKYQKKHTQVLAHRYSGEPVNALPDWLQEHRANTLFSGVVGVTHDGVMKRLWIPVAGTMVKCERGDWLVYDSSNVMTVCRDSDFATMYEPA
jgi:hypothetical protein